MNKGTGREINGPEFDNRLIRLVRGNPAIYDVSHPYYRRNPIRVAIWERIAAELNSTSRFLQTKWKNIRYNYLQELKCLETGHMNANVRKRRFTEDLSFLQNTAQSYNVKIKHRTSYNSSDTESNSHAYVDLNRAQNASDVIEIDHDSNDSYTPQAMDEEPPAKMFNGENLQHEEHDDDATPLSIVQGQQLRTRSMTQLKNGVKSPVPSYHSEEEQEEEHDSSSLLMPLVVMHEDKKPIMVNGKSRYAQHAASSSNSALEDATNFKSSTTNYATSTMMNDPIELYCLSLVDSLRNMPRSERERVKYEFAKILKDAKYKDQS